MTLRKREHPEARAELRDAAFWYDDQRPNLGADFTDAIDATIRHILDYPLGSPAFPGWDEHPMVPSARVSVFPYRVVYYVTEKAVVIIAYAHHRRRPGYWKDRV